MGTCWGLSIEQCIGGKIDQDDSDPSPPPSIQWPADDYYVSYRGKREGEKCKSSSLFGKCCQILRLNVHELRSTFPSLVSAGSIDRLNSFLLIYTEGLNYKYLLQKLGNITNIWFHTVIALTNLVCFLHKVGLPFETLFAINHTC